MLSVSTSSPDTSMRIFSSGVVITPAGVTAFCWEIALITSSSRTPIEASWSGEKLR